MAQGKNKMKKELFLILAIIVICLTGVAVVHAGQATWDTEPNHTYNITVNNELMGNEILPPFIYDCQAADNVCVQSKMNGENGSSALGDFICVTVPKDVVNFIILRSL